jgi:hypothetical protein
VLFIAHSEGFLLVVQLLTLFVLLIVANNARGNDALSSQVQHSDLLLRNSEALKQMRFVLINSCVLLDQVIVDVLI